MSPLALLPLFAAVALAAPGAVHHQFPASTAPLGTGLVAAPAVAVAHAAPAVAVAHAAPAVAVTHHAVAPAVAQVSVPITKTIHYETKPVVTGYSSHIIKPAIPHFAAPALQAVSVQQHVVAAPVAVQQQVVAAAPAQTVVAAAAPAPAAVVADAEIIEARAAVPVAAPAAVAVQQHVVAAAPALVRAPQAGDFGPLVTKENILAPVRTHTQVIPQITQVQPEVTVRKVVHDVAVHTPVAVQTPIHYSVNQPIVAAPAVHHVAHTNVISTGHHFLGHAGHQFVL